MTTGRSKGRTSAPPSVQSGGLKAMPAFPALYEINTRVWMTELSQFLGRRATLDDIPDEAIDDWAAKGFDWIWLLSVWETGAAAQRVSRGSPEWRKEFQKTLPDLRDEDIAGSGFSIAGYSVNRDLGGAEALARLRERMARRGLRLMLDFVPNHMAPDHPWVEEHPDYFVHGSDVDLATAPQNFCRIETSRGGTVFAHGRDPCFPGWPDTLQLDYSNPALQQAMIGELLEIAGQCDGVRCDMAMLILPEVFERSWGRRAPPFWPEATRRVREKVPDFCFLAEVYWDLEWTMMQQGFDYAYDKRLYDRLRDGKSQPVRGHLQAGLGYQNRLARFLENHDEPRVAAAFRDDVHKAAAMITFLSPGMRFFNKGQLEGHRVRVSPHLVRAPVEPTDPGLASFYDRLLVVLQQQVFRDGRWRLLDILPAWDGNWTADCFIGWAWESPNNQRRIVVANFAGNQSQCYLRIPFPDLVGRMACLADLMGPARYDRDGTDILSRGLYLDLPPFGYHLFDLRAHPERNCIS